MHTAVSTMLLLVDDAVTALERGDPLSLYAGGTDEIQNLITRSLGLGHPQPGIGSGRGTTAVRISMTAPASTASRSGSSSRRGLLPARRQPLRPAAAACQLPGFEMWPGFWIGAVSDSGAAAGSAGCLCWPPASAAGGGARECAGERGDAERVPHGWPPCSWVRPAMPPGSGLLRARRDEPDQAFGSQRHGLLVSGRPRSLRRCSTLEPAADGTPGSAIGSPGTDIVAEVGHPIRRAQQWAGSRLASRRPLGSRERLYRAFLQDLIRKTDNFGDLKWLGHPIWQNVLDLWSLQEAINEIKPGVLLETGTNRGGSALFYAHLFDLLGRGRVVTVDIERMHSLEHPRVEFLIGGSLDEATLAAMRRAADGAVMVVLDSDHAAAHVLEEMRAYAPLVTPGSMMLVQDGVIDTLPMYSAFRPGPLAAIQAFLAEAPEFQVDARLDRRFLVTHHPSGWLRRR